MKIISKQFRRNTVPGTGNASVYTEACLLGAVRPQAPVNPGAHSRRGGGRPISMSPSNRDAAEHAGRHAYLLPEGVDKIFLAVVAHLIGDLFHRKTGGGQKMLGRADAAKQNVFIGRISGVKLEHP